MTQPSSPLRRDLRRVIALESSFFGIEFSIALAIGSVALLADSIDFLEDASISLLILLALNWSLMARARVGMALSLLILVPTLATIWAAYDKLMDPVPPAAAPLVATAVAALAVNAVAALLLARHRSSGGSMVKAAFLSARNDMLANLGIIGAGIATAATRSAWPDLVVGLAVAALNIAAAKEVFEAAREESLGARAGEQC